VKRLSGWALPILLGVAGIALIIAGSLDSAEEPGETLPPIARPTPGPTVAAPTASPPLPTPTGTGSPDPGGTPTPEETPTPLPDDVIAVQLELPAVAINVALRQSTSEETDSFPPSDAAYILRSSSQPGRNTSSYVFAHALNTLFKPLWNVQLGAEVLVRMSDGSVLTYAVTEVRPNVPCPDPSATTDNPEDFGIEPPLALQVHDTCAEGQRWLQPTDHERLTLQTSQGYNRNWGELVVIGKPVR
jgi:hypothetical protein